MLAHDIVIIASIVTIIVGAIQIITIFYQNEIKIRILLSILILAGLITAFMAHYSYYLSTITVGASVAAEGRFF